jgi:hypothetical protein
LIADVLQFFRGEDGDAQVAYSKGDLGGEDIVTAQHFQGSGMDSQPLPGDYMLLVPGPEAGTFVVAGYLDPANAGKARAGEVSLYVRDGNGDVTGELYLAESEPDWKATAGALIARADHVDAELAKIESAFNGHTHGFTHGGTSTAPDVTDGPMTVNPPIPPEETIISYDRGPTGAEKGWVT